MNRCTHHFDLHQTAGRFLGVRQRLFNGDPVGDAKRIENGLLLCVIKVFDKVHDVVAFHLAHGLGQFQWRKALDHFFAQAFFEFGQDFTVHPAAPKLQKRTAVTPIYLFQKVGDISGVQRVQQVVNRCRIAQLDSLQHRVHNTFGQALAVVFDVGQIFHLAPPIFAQHRGSPPVSKKVYLENP